MTLEELAKLTQQMRDGFDALLKENAVLRKVNEGLLLRLRGSGGGLPTTYALKTLGMHPSQLPRRTCRTCDNYCNGPMNCNGAGEESCTTWAPRPGLDIRGEEVKCL